MAANTFVFIDLETHDLFMPKITEICLIAVTRGHILEAYRNKNFSPPRALNKLSLCISPQATIHPQASDITGLTNEMLESFPVFNEQVASLVQTFFQLLPEPVCMVAHNGFKFDFPTLKVALCKIKQNLPIPVRCSDTLPGFKKVFNDWSIVASNSSNEAGPSEIRGINPLVNNEAVRNLSNGGTSITIRAFHKVVEDKTTENKVNQAAATTTGNSKENKTVTNDQAVENVSNSTNQANLLDDGNDELFANIDCEQLMAEADELEYFSQVIDPSDVDFDIRKSCSQLSWDTSSRETPKRARLNDSPVNGDKSPEIMCIDVETDVVINGNNSAGEPARPSNVTPVKIRKDLFPLASPPASYKLIDVYERLRHSRPVAHRAEADVLMMLECVLVMGPEILNYFDDNFTLFENI